MRPNAALGCSPSGTLTNFLLYFVANSKSSPPLEIAAQSKFSSMASLATLIVSSVLPEYEINKQKGLLTIWVFDKLYVLLTSTFMLVF